MSLPCWLRDSITRRFALAIATAAAATLLLNLVVDALLGGPAFRPPPAPSLLDQIPGIVRRLDAAPVDQRAALAKATTTRMFRVDWDPADASLLPRDRDVRIGMPAGEGLAVKITTVAGHRPPAVNSSFVVAPLQDGGTVIFTPIASDSDFPHPNWLLLRISIVVLAVMAVSLVGASRLARPINAFTAAARRFGTDPNASPMLKQGPAEMQMAIAAFNAMQSQIQRFVGGQQAMFAAISHDLRTPLTRMRLRGEFIEDRQQQARLFRDVDEMQGMVDAALLFMRDNAADEATTRLDIAELLCTIIDDYADLGTEVLYSGPRHVAFPGRPIGLRRAFGNLVDNAVKYGVRPTIDMQLRDTEIVITVADEGPGIPAAALEEVFTPFNRLEASRNRHTGGMGLGLTSARASFRAHGGDVTLHSPPGGGLQAIVFLPFPPSASGDR
jgi:two-component system osmolarity sensor histidine kinase EnvZ